MRVESLAAADGFGRCNRVREESMASPAFRFSVCANWKLKMRGISYHHVQGDGNVALLPAPLVSGPKFPAGGMGRGFRS